MKHYLNQKSGPQSVVSPTGDSAAGFMEDIIREIGSALSLSQEKLDEILMEAMQFRLKEVVENPQLILPQPAAFVVPEARLDLNMLIKAKTDSSGEFRIETKPHNASTQVKSKVNQEVSSKISLKFNMIPEEADKASAGRKVSSKQAAEHIRKQAIEQIAIHNDYLTKPEIAYTKLTVEYISDSRKWHVTAYDNEEAFALLIFDDTTGEFIDLLLLSPNHRTLEDISVLTRPLITEINKQVAYLDETITITGENLGALNMSDSVVRIGSQLIQPLEVSFEKITFKITPDLISGLISVTTPEGTDTFHDPLIIPATPQQFLGGTNYGYFNPENKQGSLIKMAGTNISANTELMFADRKTTATIVKFTSTNAQFRVPEDAKSGPVTLVTGGIDVALNQTFYLRPYIKDVIPKEARHQSLVRVTGNHFSNVSKLRIGDRVFNLDESEENGIYAIKSARSILFEVPKNAGDGRMYLYSQEKWWDTSIFFYQVPSLQTVPDFLIEGESAEILGYGFGKSHQGLYIEYQSQGTIEESRYVSHKEDGILALGMTQKSGMITDKIRIIRSEIASDEQYDETTALWARKVPVFQTGTPEDHITWCSSTWLEVEHRWEYTGLEIMPERVLKVREKDSFLTYTDENKPIPKYFVVYGEFYQTENLQIALDLLHPMTKAVQRTLKILNEEDEVTLSFGDLQVTLEERLPLDRSLFVKLVVQEDVFSLQFNDQVLIYDLSEQSDVSDIMSAYEQLDGQLQLRIQTDQESFISSIIIAHYDSLNLPSFSQFLWDFDPDELMRSEQGYSLEPLSAFPSYDDTEFTLHGKGFTHYTTVMINNIRFRTEYKSDTEIIVDLSTGLISNGELFAYDYLKPEIKSPPIPFRVIREAWIDSSSTHAISGEKIIIRGDYFTENGIPLVYIEKFGPLEISTFSNELIEVIAPKLTLIGASLRLVYSEDLIKISPDAISVSSLNSYDFLRNAFDATWQVPDNLDEPTVLPFGSDSLLAEGYGAVTKRKNVILDDGKLYEEVLLITCPNPEFHYIEGRFEDFYLPVDWEMTFKFGFLQEANQTDGVKVSVFLEREGNKTYFIDRAFEVYGGDLTTFSISPGPINLGGTLVIRVEPGSSGFDDQVALVEAQLSFTHVENGWTLLFGSDKTNILTVPGTKDEPHANNMPGSRSFPAVWQDVKGVIWLFGGYGNDVNPRNGRLNDLWTFDGDTWTWKNGLYSTNGYSKFSEVPGEMTTPGARYATVHWQDNQGVFWLFGGHGYHEGGRQRSLNDLWKFTKDEGWHMVAISRDWRSDLPHGTYGDAADMFDHHQKIFATDFWPLTRHFSASYFDEKTERLWMFGGFYDEPDLEFYISDLWTFDGTQWELQNGDDTRNYLPDLTMKRPSSRCGAAIWTDDEGTLWMFGGYGVARDEPVRSLNDLWMFKKGKWKLVQDNNFDLSASFVQNYGWPGPRAHSAVWKDSDGVVWMFGGEGSNTSAVREAPLNDLWKFENGEWTYVEGPLEMRDMGQVTTPKVPNPNSWPSSRFGTAHWVNPTGWLMMFGAKGYGDSQNTGYKSLGRLQQLWQFSPEG